MRALRGHRAGTAVRRARAHTAPYTHTLTHTRARARSRAEVLSYAAQCLWFGGSVLPIDRPQNVAGMTGHLLYKGTAPIFVTGKLADIEWLHSAALVSNSSIPNFNVEDGNQPMLHPPLGTVDGK